MKIRYSPNKIKKLLNLYNLSLDNTSNTWQNLIDFLHLNPHLITASFYQNAHKSLKTNLLVKCLEEDNIKLAQYIIENIPNFDINQQLDSGINVLTVAVAKLNVEMVQLLIKHKANINVVNQEQENLVFYLRPYEENIPQAKIILDMLLDKGININQLSKIGNNALLEHSTKFSNVPFNWLKYLVEKGSNINIINEYGYNGFLYACWKQDKELIEYYYKKGADLNKRNYKSEGPLELNLSLTYEATDDFKYLLSLEEVATEENIMLALNNKSLKFTLNSPQNEIKKMLEMQLNVIKEKKHLDTNLEEVNNSDKPKKHKL